MESSEVYKRESFQNKYLLDLPIPEAFDAEEDTTEYMTSIVWDPIEHFIHHPGRTLSEYGWSREQLKKVNWPAIRIAWQRNLKRYKENAEQVGIRTGREVGDDGQFIKYDVFGELDEPKEYDPSRAKDPKAVKEDYLDFRRDLVTRVGKFNTDEPKFGLPEDLYD